MVVVTFSPPQPNSLSRSLSHFFVPLSFLHLFQMCKQCLDCTKFGLNLCEWDITTVLKMENTEETAVCSTLYNEYYWMKLFLIVLWRQKASACVFVGFFALLLLPNKPKQKKRVSRKFISHFCVWRMECSLDAIDCDYSVALVFGRLGG